MSWVLWEELLATQHVFGLTTSQHKYEINGPKGATREEALEQFEKRVETANPEDRSALRTAIAIAKFKRQHPEYNDLTEEQFADKLYSQFYTDIPRAEFDAKVNATQISLTETLPPDWPVVLGVGARKQYVLLQTKTCP